jgi:hypothetical protein
MRSAGSYSIADQFARTTATAKQSVHLTLGFLRSERTFGLGSQDFVEGGNCIGELDQMRPQSFRLFPQVFISSTRFPP